MNSALSFAGAPETRKKVEVGRPQTTPPGDTMNQPAQTVPRKAVTPSRFALSWTAAAALSGAVRGIGFALGAFGGADCVLA